MSEQDTPETGGGGTYEDAYRPGYTNATGGSTGGQPESAPAPEEPATPDDQPASIPADSELVPEGYESMTKEELKDELAARDLQVSGNKPDLVERLEEDDTAQDAGG